MKKLYKNEHDEVLTGVIGGVGEYFNVDPTVLRIAFVILVLVTGVFPGIIAYIIAYFIIPEKPHGVSTLVTPPPMKTPEPMPSKPPVEIKSTPIVPLQPLVKTELPKNELVGTPISNTGPVDPEPITVEESKVTVEGIMEGPTPEATEDTPEETEKKEDDYIPEKPKNPPLI